MIGLVTGRKIEKNKDGKADRILLQVQVTSPDDIRTVELFTSAGEDSNPVDGSKVIIFDIGRAYQVAVAVDDGITPEMEVGERKIYANADGSITSYINFLSDGTLELNKNDNFAIFYNEMLIAFNLLKTELNAFITIFNQHTQLIGPDPITTLPTALAPTIPGVPATADMSPAQNLKVKM